MSTHSGTWRVRLGHVVKAMPAKAWIALGVASVVVLASGLIHPALPSFILMGLGASVVMGREVR